MISHKEFLELERGNEGPPHVDARMCKRAIVLKQPKGRGGKISNAGQQRENQNTQMQRCPSAVGWTEDKRGLETETGKSEGRSKDEKLAHLDFP